ATRSNGLEGLDAELRIHSPLHARHLATLAELQRSKTFDYSGRNEEGEARFLSGECAILTSSSGFYGRIRANVRFAFDALPLPYYPEAEGAPQNTLIGGASLWAMSGKTPHEYKGVARFFAFLSETERQAMLHQRLGYLPVTRAAYDATRASGFYRTTPLLETALLSLTRKPVTPNSRGLRLGDMTALRDAWAEEIEAALRGEKTADAALAAAQARGDAILRRFEARAQ
ncbi:MAG TPA: extracellular solute-binding protein, partial [Beijerinckiaceae bacterium]